MLLIKCFFYPVNSIALVKPERAQQVEAMLIQMAQTGQIVGKVIRNAPVKLIIYLVMSV